MKRSLLIALMVALLAFGSAAAQDNTGEADTAIAFAAALPQFSQGLSLTEGWEATAYPTGHWLGLWRVTFFDAAGTEIGTADVSLERGRAYAVQQHYFYPPEWLKEEARPVLLDFLAAQPEVMELIDDPAGRDIWLDYDSWNGWWYVHLEAGIDSVYAVVQFDDSSTFSLSSPRLIEVGFPNIMSWDDWRTANGSSAASIAFTQPEIAARLRDERGWTSAAYPADDGGPSVWWVGFYSGEALAAEATVDLASGSILYWAAY